MNPLQHLWKPSKKSILGFFSFLFLCLFLVASSTKLQAQVQTTACDADISHDGIVNLGDYTILAQHFSLFGETNSEADITKDGQVDILDYHALVTHFFQSCVQSPTPIPPHGDPSPAPSPTPIPTPAPATPTPSPSPTAIPIGSSPNLGGCSIFPADNPWNQDISQTPLHPLSANYVTSIGANASLHPDMGGAAYGESYGIPFITVTNQQAHIPVYFAAYGDESDPGPYPIPLNAPIEGGPSSDGDRHVIVVETTSCTLYELYRAFPGTNSWTADSGAIFDLKSNNVRPKGWTSADAAGLPILPGLVRYGEVSAGEINHAIRFTAPTTQRGFIFPARHFASSSTNPDLPPMGLRMRLKANYDISGLTGQARIIAIAMKKYGIILADNGSSWYFQGETNPNWNDDELNQLKAIKGSDFEAVYTGDIEN